MISYFTKILPDETLYSLICRFKNHNCPLGYHDITQLLFGLTHITIRPDLPIRLREFSERTIHILGLDVSEVISKLTIWPYYLHFLNEGKKERILGFLKTETGTNFLQTCGLMSNYFPRSGFPKYCPACLNESYKYYGIYYWKRVHQIPHIIVCPIHNCFLKTAIVNPLVAISKFNLVEANEESCELLNIEENTDSFLFDMANTMHRILLDESVQSSPFNRQALKQFFEKKYKKYDFKTFKQLKIDLSSFYNDKPLSFYINEYQFDESNYNLFFLQDYSKSEIPIKNLLLTKYIQNSLSVEVPETNQSLDFPETNCFNIFCGEQNLKAIKEIRKKGVGDSFRFHLYFKCNCGSEWSIRYIDLNVTGKRRISTIGNSLKEKIAEFINKGYKLKVITKLCNLSQYFIKKSQQSNLKLKVRNSRYKKLKGSNRKSKSKEFRKEWTKILNKNPSLTIGVIRKSNKVIYSYLISYNKNWFKKINAKHLKNYRFLKKSKVVDSLLLTDKKNSEAILRAYEILTKNKYRKIITRSLLLRVAKIPRTKALIKLPKMNALIYKLVENKEQRDKRLGI
ncbi:MAG: TnsD family Tn7-like transposition protein [Cyclobacteriaceae bacterium]|nr:TnsD family Tn7-like transposition protein [Cytophagales bacterium]MCZ8327776.1 TnsD family Tn7-like transposition protein [Cyclobacteriaceae bacterium]